MDHEKHSNGSLRPTRSRVIFQSSIEIKFLTSLRKYVFFFDTKVDTAHFPDNRFVSNIEIALGNTFRLDPVQVSFNSVGYSKSYRCPKVLETLRVMVCTHAW